MPDLPRNQHGIASIGRRAVEFAPLVALLTLGLLPLVRQSVIGTVAVFGEDAPAFGTARAVALFGKSIGIAAGATLVGLVLGGLSGLLMARLRMRVRSVLLLAMFAVFCVSPYILALGWLGARLDGPLAGAMLGRPLVVSWILGTAFAPLAALVVFAALRLRSTSAEDAAFVMGSPLSAGLRVALPRMLPGLAVAGVLVFSFSLSDYAVGSLLQVPTYPIEVFLYYAGMFRPDIAARACLPLFAAGLIASVATAWWIGAFWKTLDEARRDGAWPLTASWRTGLWLILLGTLGLAALVPLGRLVLAWSGPDVAVRALSGGATAALNSILLSVLAVAAALVLAWPSAVVLGALHGPTRVALMTALLLPLFIPPTAFGIAWVELWAAAGLTSAGLGVLSGVLCLAARFGGVLAVFLAAMRSRIASQPLEAAALHERSALRRWIRIEAPVMAPVAGAAAGGVMAMALNSAGILVLTAPPGFEVLPLRVDNLLHYGLPEEAAALALGTAVLAIAPAALGFVALRLARQWSGQC